MLGARSSQPVDYISITDPAVNVEASDYTEFYRTFDRKHVVLHEGATPSVFTLRRLSRKRFETIAANVGQKPAPEQASQIVAYGLKGVKNFRGTDGDEVRLSFLHQGQADERIESECLDRMYAPELFAELAQAIMILSTLDPLAASR